MNSKQVHVIYPIDSHGHAYTMIEAELSDYFGKTCIKGKSLATKQPHYVEGSEVFVPLDRIDFILVYENEQTWRAAMATYKPPPKKSGWFGRKN